MVILDIYRGTQTADPVRLLANVTKYAFKRVGCKLIMYWIFLLLDIFFFFCVKGKLIRSGHFTTIQSIVLSLTFNKRGKHLLRCNDR